MLDRVMRVIKLDKSVYAEVEADQMATSQAAIVVAIVAVLSAIGSGIGTFITAGGEGFIMAFLSAILGSFIGWLVWSAVTYFVGTSLFHGEATIGEMLRVIGFAQAPLALNVLSFIPCLGAIISLAAWLFSLYTGFLAIQEGLDLDTNKTIATVVIGWIVSLIVSLVIGMIFGGGMAIVGVLTGMLSG
ncbi:MAG: YIP1 family protein [Anaerolineae bacterium]|nr:YIP1 family protein [Anaerolineae bacterium]